MILTIPKHFEPLYNRSSGTALLAVIRDAKGCLTDGLTNAEAVDWLVSQNWPEDFSSWLVEFVAAHNDDVQTVVLADDDTRVSPPGQVPSSQDQPLTCAACGGEISDTTNTCPHCGIVFGDQAEIANGVAVVHTALRQEQPAPEAASIRQRVMLMNDQESTQQADTPARPLFAEPTTAPANYEPHSPIASEFPAWDVMPPNALITRTQRPT